MKRLLLLILLIGGATGSRAQLPVVDVAVLAETVTTVAELRRQVDLLLKEVALSSEIKQNTQTHLHRYERALSKRGLIPTEPLGTYLQRLQRAYKTAGGVTWNHSEGFRRTFPMYQDPPDPLAARRAAHEQTMSTLQGTLASLQVHDNAAHHAHKELEHLKQEIVHAKEPQQMRDVQTNLQVVHARELLLTRQAFMMLVNLEAVRAADAVSRKAQQQMRYDALVGNSAWLGDPARYSVKHFLKMPGTP